MDFFSHLFWTTTLYKIIKNKTKRPLNLWRAAFWGVFPDLFAFGVPFLLLGAEYIFGKEAPADFAFKNVLTLYPVSHSIVVFGGVLILAYAAISINRRTVKYSKLPKAVPLEMGGWLFHIILDIPTHSSFQTPFLWPLSDFKINGFWWGTPWFLIINYLLIIIAYFCLWRKKDKF